MEESPSKKNQSKRYLGQQKRRERESLQKQATQKTQEIIKKEKSDQIKLKDPDRVLEEIKLLEKKTELMYGLPFLYGWKWYKWAREFFESRNKLNFLCAANQISKSSSQIRKCIDWATDQTKWPDLWVMRPNQFWYLYPSQDVVNAEFSMKWSQFLPKGRFKNDDYYGWKEIKKGSDIIGIKFFSGITVLFKTYSKNPQNLQSGSVFAMFADEEIPENIYDELINRLNATNGYFHLVFTATMGQDIWRLTMEPNKHEDEKFPQAAKWTVSLYEAMFYDDGTPSHWNVERIKEVEAKCKSPQEVAKRVYGRFVVDEYRTYPTFNASKHVIKKHPLPSSWNVYAGVDIGSGGVGHPAAICFVGVSPDYRQGRVFSCWRGDGQDTTNDDIVKKFIDLKKQYSITTTAQYYDWGSKDFFLVAQGLGETFLKADKSHEKGEALINTLFKNDMMLIYDDEESAKLAGELSSLNIHTKKNKSKDDLSDAFRYAISQVPFDLSGIVGIPSEFKETIEKPMTEMEREIQQRRSAFDENQEEFQRIQEEFDEWNENY